jgi:hypothetical protein
MVNELLDCTRKNNPCIRYGVIFDAIPSGQTAPVGTEGLCIADLCSQVLRRSPDGTSLCNQKVVKTRIDCVTPSVDLTKSATT